MDLVPSIPSMQTFVDRLVVAKHSKTDVFLDSDQLEDLDLIFASRHVVVPVVGWVYPQEIPGKLEKIRGFNSQVLVNNFPYSWFL